MDDIAVVRLHQGDRFANESQLFAVQLDTPRHPVGCHHMLGNGEDRRVSLDRDLSKAYVRAKFLHQGVRCNALLTYAVRQRQQRGAP